VVYGGTCVVLTGCQSIRSAKRRWRGCSSRCLCCASVSCEVLVQHLHGGHGVFGQVCLWLWCAAYLEPAKVRRDNKVCACYTLLSAVSVRNVSCAVQLPQRPLLLQGWCLALLCWTFYQWQDLTVCAVSAAVLGVVAYGWARSSACSGCVYVVLTTGALAVAAAITHSQASQGGRMLLQQVASSIQRVCEWAQKCQHLFVFVCVPGVPSSKPKPYNSSHSRHTSSHCVCRGGACALVSIQAGQVSVLPTSPLLTYVGSSFSALLSCIANLWFLGCCRLCIVHSCVMGRAQHPVLMCCTSAEVRISEGGSRSCRVWNGCWLCAVQWRVAQACPGAAAQMA
jgi:hypothetical protein